MALNAMGEGNMVGLDIPLSVLGTIRWKRDNAVTIIAQTAVRLAAWRASVVAESIGSVAGYLCTQGQKVVGLEVNANHVRSARQGARTKASVKRCIPGLAIRSGR